MGNWKLSEGTSRKKETLKAAMPHTEVKDVKSTGIYSVKNYTHRNRY